MTYAVYTYQQLQHKSIARLKQIYTEIGASVEVADKRCKECWISAIVEYQSSKIQKLTPAAPDTQAQSIAPEKLTTVVCSFYDHEIYAGKNLIAIITHDDNLTQPWVVIVNGVEQFRANTWARCHRFIQWHHQDGTLTEAAQTETETPCPTENRIMAHIFNECQNYGFEILDDGIYNNDMKLGEVGCTDGNWWVKRGSSGQQYCNSVMDAVRSLSMLNTMPHVELADYEELLDRPFEMLTNEEWELLRESAAA